jgi:hypothetical protein
MQQQTVCTRDWVSRHFVQIMASLAISFLLGLGTDVIGRALITTTSLVMQGAVLVILWSACQTATGLSAVVQRATEYFATPEQVKPITWSESQNCIVAQ